MSKQKQVYRCNICGNMVEILQAGTGNLVCCGREMQLLEERIGDVGPEKHIPIIEKSGPKLKVIVGEIPHPMEKDHHIEWIEIIRDDRVYRKFLKPNDKPEAEFEIDTDKIMAREYCNIHGLWKSQ